MDLYEQLGVEPTADERAVRAAYRRKALQHHPDVNGGDPAAAERFKQIDHAYKVLSHPGRRRQYDRRTRLPRTRASTVSSAPASTTDTPFSGVMAPYELLLSACSTIARSSFTLGYFASSFWIGIPSRRVE